MCSTLDTSYQTCEKKVVLNINFKEFKRRHTFIYFKDLKYDIHLKKKSNVHLILYEFSDNINVDRQYQK